MNAQLPHGASVHLRGQATTMSSAYVQLLEGLALSVLLVYLVIVVNFQSWLDPFIIITALPGALAGIVWSLFLTHTNGSVPALTGRDHVHGHGDGQLDPCGVVCPRAPRGTR